MERSFLASVRNQVVASAASEEMGERHAAAERPTAARSHPVAETHPRVASAEQTFVAARTVAAERWRLAMGYFLSHSVWELEPQALSDTADKFPSSPLRYRELESSLCNTGS